MAVQQGAVAGEAVDVSAGGPGKGASPGPAGALTSRAERLDYIAEIARELEAMAGQVGCPTLSGLLGLAYQEAKLRRRD